MITFVFGKLKKGSQSTSLGGKKRKSSNTFRIGLNYLEVT